MTERKQALVFGEVAETYDRLRPGYPREAIVDIEEILDLPTPARVLEIGAGTGKATVLFAERGHEIVALEPDAQMAAIAGRHLESHPNASVEVTSFEAYRGPSDPFDLVTAAQAWHWVDQESGLRLAHERLRAGGGIALLWNWEHGVGLEFRKELDRAYETHAPGLTKELLKRRVGDVIADQLESTTLFGGLVRRSYPAERAFTTEEYLALLTTHSDHRMLPVEQRRALHDAVAAVIDDHGGHMTVDYATELFVAQRSTSA